MTQRPDPVGFGPWVAAYLDTEPYGYNELTEKLQIYFPELTSITLEPQTHLLCFWGLLKDSAINAELITVRQMRFYELAACLAKAKIRWNRLSIENTTLEVVNPFYDKV